MLESNILSLATWIALWGKRGDLEHRNSLPLSMTHGGCREMCHQGPSPLRHTLRSELPHLPLSTKDRPLELWALDNCSILREKSESTVDKTGTKSSLSCTCLII